MKYLVLNSLYRSGKTVLQMALNSHSQIGLVSHGIMPFVTSWNRQFPAESNYPVFSPLCVNYYEPGPLDDKLLDGVAFDQSLIDELVSSMISSRKLEADRKGIAPSSIRSWMSTFEANAQPGSARSVFQQLTDSLPRDGLSGDESVVGFMDQNLHQFLPALISGFSSDLCAVNVNRDARAIAASRNFGKYTKVQGGGKLHPILLIARMWRTSVKYQKLMTSIFPENFHSLTYENLMLRPEIELNSICELLGVKFERKMLDTDNYRDENGEPWAHNSSFGSSNGFDPSTSERWRGIIPDDYLATLEFLLASELQEFGYELVTSSEERLSAFMKFNEAPADLAGWTLGTDLILNDEQRKIELERHERTALAN
jgi:hypothetical protein